MSVIFINTGNSCMCILDVLKVNCCRSGCSGGWFKKWYTRTCMFQAIKKLAACTNFDKISNFCSKIAGHACQLIVIDESLLVLLIVLEVIVYDWWY